jgi:exopolysaccharide/PEP-CTERM locus tyrosine autokinase
MSVIERAAKRLEELRRAGIDPSGSGAGEVDCGPTAHSLGEPVPEPVPGVSSATHEPEDPAQSPVRPGSAQPDARHVVLDTARLAKAGFITPDTPYAGIADEFRLLKRPLIANASGKGPSTIDSPNLIMVTSAVPGEGKTFCAINLAMSIAMELDRSVLLVDADVARPSIPRLLGLPATRGLLDVLSNTSIDLGEVLVRTSMEKFTVLASGTAQPRATELLASEAMRRLMSEMASRYSDRIVIFDSPPLLVTTEAHVLAAQMGQIVVVVKAETTPASDVKRAVAAIEACPVKMVVLNQARSKGQGAYGYGREHHYGYAGR